MTRPLRTVALAVALLPLGALAASCSAGEGEPVRAQLQRVGAPLTAAYCKVTVQGVGEIDMESDYLPHVIQCENGGAGIEALKAQAIAARSVAYYNMATAGSICDSQGCQVYSCGRQPSAEAIAAVQATAGMYLSYDSMLTYGFYVDGDSSPDPQSCLGTPGAPREKYVTYNSGKSGTSVEQTSLGWVGPPGFGQNRGCMAQWGARCLENNVGFSYVDILQFYYGSDIQILTAPGDCAAAPPPPPEPPASGELQPMTRDEIIDLARSGMGYSYWWGHGAWDPTSVSYPGSCSGNCGNCSHSATGGGPEYGADCSGFVAQVWQAPNPNPVTNNRHPYSTSHFRWEELDWFKISRDELERGDALVYRNAGNTGGHIVIFEEWTDGGKAIVYECAGCSTGCVHRARSIGSSYVAIRRKLVNDVDPNTKPRGYLDVADCNTIAGWAQDEDAPDHPIEVHIYVDGGPGDANATGYAITADQHREDLCSAIGSCEHGFSMDVPPELLDGEEHPVFAYAIDTDGGENPLLVGAPQTVRCSDTPPQCTSDADCWYDETCQDGVCVLNASSESCFTASDCGSGEVCAWNGDGYCCRAPHSGSAVCFSDGECAAGQVCAWNGDGFYCTAPVASCN